MIMTFIKAMLLLRWAKFFGYGIIASLEEQIDRLDECVDCPQFKEGQCLRCGCLVQAKIMLTTEQCPDKRWLRIWRKCATVK